MMEKCPKCETERNAPPDNGFCTSCGHKYQETPDNAPPEPVVEPTPEPVVEPTPEPAAPEQAGSVIESAAYIQFDGGPSIYFDEQHQKVVGRTDISDYLKSKNQNPLQVSRQHFTIFKDTSNYYITDSATSVQDKPSSNKTQVNGKDITGAGQHELKDGDTIKIAGLVEATFHSSSTDSVDDDGQQAPPAQSEGQASSDKKEQTFEEFEKAYVKKMGY